ncbi:RHS repeat-associated core domain-containing protein [Luteibacter jiangsuensis]
METIYGAFGGAHGQAGRSRSRYAGERIEADLDWYLLGRRPYHPALRRFLVPDTMSPFDAGGVNRYAYCGGDPINRIDPSGHFGLPWKGSVVPNLNSSIRPPARAVVDPPGVSATPVLVASAAAASTDVTRISANIPSGSLAAPSRPGDVVLGQLASATGPYLPATDREVLADFDLGKFEDTPPPTRQPSRSRQRAAVRGWTRQSPRPNTYIWTTNTVLTPQVAGNLTRALRSRGIKHVYVYAGYEGVRSGENWDSATEAPKYVSVGYTELAERDIVSVVRRNGTNVTLVDARGLTEESMAMRLRRMGVHVVAISFGTVDTAVTAALNAGYASTSAP